MTPMLSFENVNVAIADAPVLRNVTFRCSRASAPR